MNIAVDMVALDKDGRAGGVTWLAMELIKGFAEFEGTKVIALCTQENESFLREHLMDKVILEPLENRNNEKSLVKRAAGRLRDNVYVSRLLEKYKADIFFCPFGIVNYSVKGARTISTILDVQHEFFPEFFEKKELIVRRLIYKYIAHSAEQVICISEYTRDTFCEKYRYDKKRAEVVYIAIQERFDGYDDSILAELGLEDDGYILYPANCWKHKNHERLVQAFSVFRAENKKLSLVLTGNMFSQEGRLKEALGKNGADGLVIAGYVDEKQMHSLLRHCRGLIFPSLFEGFGIPVVEAMQQYKPVACSNTTSLPEIGCSSLFYFDPLEVEDIARGFEFIADAGMTQEMIEDYNKNLKKYDKDKMIESYMRIFSNTLS